MAKWNKFSISMIMLAYGYMAVQPVSASEKSIVTNLLSNYGPRHTRPLKNSSQSIHVTIRLLIAQIVDFDEPRQQLAVNGWQKMRWKDEYLVWNPDDYNGTDTIYVLDSDIWIPKLKLVENVNYEFISVDDVELMVTSDGNVEWLTPIMFQISCNVRVRKFPFDVQQCNATFLHWSYDMDKLNLFYFDDEDSNQYVFSNNGVWHLEKVESTRELIQYHCCEVPFSHVVYTLTLKRASQFYVFSMLIPSVLLTMITLLVFCMPPESGEKISLGMTNLLAFILFQQLIAGAMPPQGTEVPIVVMYLFCMVLVGCTSIFASVYVLRLFHLTADKPIPERVVWFTTRIYRRKDSVTWQEFAKIVDNLLFYCFMLISCAIILITGLLLLA